MANLNKWWKLSASIKLAKDCIISINSHGLHIFTILERIECIVCKLSYNLQRIKTINLWLFVDFPPFE